MLGPHGLMLFLLSVDNAFLSDVALLEASAGNLAWVSCVFVSFLVALLVFSYILMWVLFCVMIISGLEHSLRPGAAPRGLQYNSECPCAFG